jgi:hypothetical protein
MDKKTVAAASIVLAADSHTQPDEDASDANKSSIYFEVGT